MSSLQAGIEGSRGFPTDRGPSVSLVGRTPLAGLQTWAETILRCQCAVQWPAVVTRFVCDNGGTFLEQDTLLSKGPAPGHVTTDDLSALSGTHDLTIVLDSDERSGLSCVTRLGPRQSSTVLTNVHMYNIDGVFAMPTMRAPFQGLHSR